MLVVSPHLDDAVLSCGGTIRWYARHGVTVVVVTIFAGVPVGSPTPLALAATCMFGPAAGDVAVRRIEDAEACGRLGARPIALPFLDCVHRRDRAGRSVYLTRATIFGELAQSDRRLPTAISEALRRLPEWSAADTVLIPLGIGGHVDHRLARSAAQAAIRNSTVPRRSVAYYEDVPYVLYADETQWSTNLAGTLKPHVRPLDEDCEHHRIAAIRRYASQLPSLWPDDLDWPAALRQRARSVGAGDHGERLWLPR